MTNCQYYYIILHNCEHCRSVMPRFVRSMEALRRMGMGKHKVESAKKQKRQICDIKGQKFGRLTALEPTEKRQRNSVVWNCLCDCGEFAEVSVSCLKSGGTKSCGCLKKETAARIGAAKRSDISGQRFGRLIALEPTAKRQGTAIVWHCVCDCGNTADISIASLHSGETRSCGCLQKEITSEIGAARKIDLTGQQFGTLTALEATKKRQGSSVVWLCRCECGNLVEYSSRALKSGNLKSCGCAEKAVVNSRSGRLCCT